MSKSKSDLTVAHHPRSRRMANRRISRPVRDTGLQDYVAVEERLKNAERRYYLTERDYLSNPDWASARDDYEAAALEMADAVEEIMAVRGIPLSAVKKKLGWLGKEDRIENLVAFAKSYRDMKRRENPRRGIAKQRSKAARTAFRRGDHEDLPGGIRVTWNREPKYWPLSVRKYVKDAVRQGLSAYVDYVDHANWNGWKVYAGTWGKKVWLGSGNLRGQQDFNNDGSVRI